MLKIISRSSVDLETVLDTLVETVARLCRADQATMFRRRDDKYHLVAARGFSEEAKEFVRTHPVGARSRHREPAGWRWSVERSTSPMYCRTRNTPIAKDRRSPATARSSAFRCCARTRWSAYSSINRTRVEPFTDKEIELATTFADQAVIAIENARLFDELRDRQADLARSVDELTATSDVLKIISRSTVDLETVLDTLVETVMRLCRADQAYMVRRRGDIYHVVAARGLSEEAGEYFRTHPVALSRGTMRGRVALERRAVHIPDVLQDPEYTYSEGQKLAGYRTMLGIPLLREDTLVGMFPG